MRHADDISDDESLHPEERYHKLDEWLQNARRAFGGETTDDAVLFALADAQRRYKVPVELFEKLVQGTAMDLEHSLAAAQSAAADPNAGQAPVALYATFEDLYQYCYHVASVVGLVCIRIFGYRDSHAEILEVALRRGDEREPLRRDGFHEVRVAEQVQFPLAAVELAVGEAAVAAVERSVEEPGVTGELDEPADVLGRHRVALGVQHLADGQVLQVAAERVHVRSDGRRAGILLRQGADNR